MMAEVSATVFEMMLDDGMGRYSVRTVKRTSMSRSSFSVHTTLIIQCFYAAVNLSGPTNVLLAGVPHPPCLATALPTHNIASVSTLTTRIPAIFTIVTRITIYSNQKKNSS